MDRSENKLKIGIFGGSFDPVHIGHLIIAESARNQFCLEKIIFIPAGIPPHRDALIATGRHRLEMTKLAIADNPNFEVSDIEIKKEGISYTYETLQIIQKQLNAEFYIIVGWDAFVILPSWYNAEKLAEQFPFIVAPRIVEKQQAFQFPFQVKYEMLDIPRIEISSTLIRRKIKAGQSIRYLVPDSVLKYIYQEKLYE
ncbi:MAG: nicotinate-nucleotide adenylyltransferase [Candidatus Omnitrophica bacterium]|jgi:nicotinate-nucleotide adenylyltransferase|nr:nicotinate-nucleotide adenylyltransferase [Candidatus Omnitrophota bacterium]